MRVYKYLILLAGASIIQFYLYITTKVTFNQKDITKRGGPTYGLPHQMWYVQLGIGRTSSDTADYDCIELRQKKKRRRKLPYHLVIRCRRRPTEKPPPCTPYIHQESGDISNQSNDGPATQRQWIHVFVMDGRTTKAITCHKHATVSQIMTSIETTLLLQPNSYIAYVGTKPLTRSHNSVAQNGIQRETTVHAVSIGLKGGTPPLALRQKKTARKQQTAKYPQGLHMSQTAGRQMSDNLGPHKPR